MNWLAEPCKVLAFINAILIAAVLISALWFRGLMGFGFGLLGSVTAYLLNREVSRNSDHD